MTSSSHFIIAFILVLLMVSTYFHIQCTSQWLFDTTSESVTSIVRRNPDSFNDVQSSTELPMFDRTVRIAQKLIDSGLPESTTNSTSISTTTTKKTNFNIKKWEKRTSGGLTDPDRIKLAEIYGAADSVFEYGLGESTYLANAMKVRRYAGIDSDALWVSKAREQVPDTYRFYFADIGPTVSWGYPKNRNKVPSKSIYHYQIMPLAAESEAFDVYMSDGRWRIPCMVASFLHASARGADPQKTIVLLHDCFRAEHWKNGTEPLPNTVNLRLSYFKADHLLNLVDHSGNRLCVYKRKPETTDKQLEQFWEENYDMID